MGFVGFGCDWFCLDCVFYVVDFVANCGCGCGYDGFCGFFFLLPVVVVSGLQVVGSCLWLWLVRQRWRWLLLLVWILWWLFVIILMSYLYYFK